MDGATIGRELVYVLTPMAIPGLASTLLLNFILAWNEAFWTLKSLDAGRRAAHGIHRILFKSRGSVLGKNCRPRRRSLLRRSSFSGGSRSGNSFAD